MSKHNVFKKQFILAVFCVSTAWGQGSGYLAQKLMVENDLRQRITDAMSKIIDDRKYVIDVDADIEISGGSEEQITILDESQRSSRKIEEVSSAVEGALDQSVESQSQSGSITSGLPIPGFEFESDAGKSAPVNKDVVTPSTLSEPPSSNSGQGKVLSRTVTSKHPSTAYVKKLEISIILQEGAAPELIENIRQVVMVASRFNRARGDALSIMTATFKERRDEKTAEQILLKNIAEKLESLEQLKSSDGFVNWKEELDSYKAQEEERREQDKMYFQQQLTGLESAARERAYQAEKRDILRRDSLKLQALNNEISNLKSMISSDEISGDEADQAQSAMGEKMSEKEKLDAQIAEKMAMLDAVQSDLDRMNGGRSSTMMIVFVSLLGALVIVLVVVLVIMIMGNRQKQQLPPPWMYPPRPRKKKSENNTVRPPQPTASPQTVNTIEDTGVLQSEISDMRQAVVSMSVSQPNTATRIVKEWMEDDSPPPETEPVVVAAPLEQEDEDAGKKKKKKKKK